MRLVGLAPRTAAADLLPGLITTPYLLGTFLAAAVVVWAAPQAWSWTREMRGTKALTAAALLVASVVALALQGFNPFLYFLF